MKKILTLLSHGFLASSFSSNAVLHNSISDQLNLKQNHKLDLKNHIDVYNALESWHNGLTLEQDAKAKQEYEDAMNITTIKGANQGFDKYNITFNNDKLKDMQKEGLINQDIYDIWSDPSNASLLTYKSNQLIDSSQFFGGATKLVHVYDSSFTIQNNKLHFTDKKVVNNKIKPKYSSNYSFTFDQILNVIEDFWSGEHTLKMNEYVKLIKEVQADQSQESIDDIASELSRILMKAVDNGELTLGEFVAVFGEEVVYNGNHSRNISSETIIRQILEENNDMLELIKDDNDGNDSGVSYLAGEDIDPITSDITYWIDDIKPIPPLGKGIAKWTDKDAEWDNNPVSHLFKFTSNLSYAKYGSLWEYLNSNLTFNLHEKFESRIGWLTQDKNFNYDFDKDQSISVLKKYWNKYSTLTSKKWISRDVSMAEIDLEIVDNTVKKTIDFNFKSVLQNQNAIQNCYNFMY